MDNFSQSTMTRLHKKKYEKEMASLFGNLVFKYYKKDLRIWKFINPHIGWYLDSKYENNSNNNLLPTMRTDIVFENKDLEPTNSKQLIIDTKFYSNILSEKSSLNFWKSLSNPFLCK